MAFSKKTYTSGQTAITADNLNAIQDELIRVGGAGTLPVADYVVEQGTSDIWTYRKWSSGVAECWGSYTTAGGSNPEGSLYWKGTSIAYPSGLFIATPIAEAILQGKWIAGISNSNLHSKDSFAGYVWTALNTPSDNFIINIRATGRWK